MRGHWNRLFEWDQIALHSIKKVDLMTEPLNLNFPEQYKVSITRVRKQHDTLTKRRILFFKTLAVTRIVHEFHTKHSKDNLGGTSSNTNWLYMTKYFPKTIQKMKYSIRVFTMDF